MTNHACSMYSLLTRLASRSVLGQGCSRHGSCEEAVESRGREGGEEKGSCDRPEAGEQNPAPRVLCVGSVLGILGEPWQAKSQETF